MHHRRRLERDPQDADSRRASEGAEDGDAGAARPPAGGGGANAADAAMGGVTTDDFIKMCDGFLNDDVTPSSSFPLDTLDERFWNDNLGVPETEILDTERLLSNPYGANEVRTVSRSCSAASFSS